MTELHLEPETVYYFQDIPEDVEALVFPDGSRFPYWPPEKRDPIQAVGFEIYLERRHWWEVWKPRRWLMKAVMPPGWKGGVPGPIKRGETKKA